MDLTLVATASHLTDATLSAIAAWRVLKSLDTLRLNLSGNGNITPRGFQALGYLLDRRTSHLRYLQLAASNPIGWPSNMVKETLAAVVDTQGVVGCPRIPSRVTSLPPEKVISYSLELS